MLLPRQRHAQATYRNGILELHIPRTEASQARRIKIQGKHRGAEQAQSAEAQPAVEKEKAKK